MSDNQPTCLVVGPVLVDTKSRVACVEGKPLRLTGAEYLILQTLAAAGGKPVSQSDLTRLALGREMNSDSLGLDRSIDQLVYRLRMKLPPDAYGQPLIQTLRGQGYWVQPGVPA